MLTFKEYKTVISAVLIFLTMAIIFLAGLLEYKNLMTSPDILVQQSLFDGVNDRIIKTKDNLKSFETIFTAPNIQDFETTKNQLLVTTGVQNQESKLQLVDIITKNVKKLDYKDKFITRIVSGGERFAVMAEDLQDVEGKKIRNYKPKLAIVTEKDQQITEINPQFLATEVDNIFINPSGNLLIFTGFGYAQYLLDLDDTNNISKLANITPDNNINLGFINDTQLALTNYSPEGNPSVKLVDVLKNETKLTSLNKDTFSKIVVSGDGQNIYYSQSKNKTNIKGLKNYKTGNVYSDPKYSFENINLSTNDLFVLFEKKSANSINSNTIYSAEEVKSFAIFNLKAQVLPTEIISGTKAIWAK
jgi:hypothetical protein